eukprot:CAMPEP_0172611654 /NCGR_PEP_ID=MMETSP1068-20121228/31310_1 /TAXON_ID=35684 /ORGANISM="Pseudopedinella elastica, Strain CCMP716" /LENGTH=96 /DNA_ID=CAMNT_0013415689 /DNA_START=59 /DNA_END=349 /DNA_ORIENTATION=+
MGKGAGKGEGKGGCKGDDCCGCSPCWCWTCWIFWFLMVVGFILVILWLEGELTESGSTGGGGGDPVESDPVKETVLDKVVEEAAELASRRLRGYAA